MAGIPLEEMGAFFDSRLDIYDAHQLNAIDGAQEFYPFTAACLPCGPEVQLLDLGCGTGLELDYYFRRCPDARVTGIDLAPGMLAALREKFPDRALTLVQGSYFDLPFGERCFDAAVSVESLHHFTLQEKIPLYAKLCRALRPGGCFILTDYFADSDEQERQLRQELLRLRAEQQLPPEVFYHFDTPLTLAHEQQALREAGFRTVQLLRTWGATAVLRAEP